MDGYVSVIFDARTGLHHGALYLNRPTPSGCARYLLSASLDAGERTAREAGIAGNAAFPLAIPVDPKALSDVDVAGIAFAPGSTVTLVTPVSDEAKLEGGPVVEVGAGPGAKVVDVSLETLRLLVAMGRLRPDSGSGPDPELHHSYEHFLAA